MAGHKKSDKSIAVSLPMYSLEELHVPKQGRIQSFGKGHILSVHDITGDIS